LSFLRLPWSSLIPAGDLARPIARDGPAGVPPSRNAFADFVALLPAFLRLQEKTGGVLYPVNSDIPRSRQLKNTG